MFIPISFSRHEIPKVRTRNLFTLQAPLAVMIQIYQRNSSFRRYTCWSTIYLKFQSYLSQCLFTLACEDQSLDPANNLLQSRYIFNHTPAIHVQLHHDELWTNGRTDCALRPLLSSKTGRTNLVRAGGSEVLVENSSADSMHQINGLFGDLSRL